MKLLNFSIIKFTFCLIVGIIISKLFSISILYSLLFCVGFTLITIGFYFTLKKKKSFIYLFGISVYLTFIAFGIFITNINGELQKTNHFSHAIDKDQANQTITFRIRERLKPNAFSQRYYVDILKLNAKNVKGKALINIRKDSLNIPIPIDAVYLSKTNVIEIKAPLNPDQFSYKAYLEKQQIYYQIYANQLDILELKSETSTVFGHAARFRNYINKALSKYQYSDEQSSIINALILGQRQNITKEVYDNYTNAGAIHILAVSGLHIGIILLLLNFVFKPIERIKNGKLIKTIILVILLWTYALIAGGSASIIRATTMFSIVAIGINLKRPTNIYNTLAISVFILLLIKPNFLFDVGFQLSYAAVISIVSFQPILERLYSPKYKLNKLLWQTLTVTVSAQFGIIPISLYYFHQFPSLFWLSNLIVIPFLSLILGLGLVVITCAILGIPKSFISDTFGAIINWMNQFFAWISNQEDFLILDIPFTLLQVVVSYLLIFSIYQLCIQKNYTWTKFTLVSVIVLQLTYILNQYHTKGDSFLVFHKNRTTLIAKKHNNQLAIYSTLKHAETNTIIRSYAVKNALQPIASKPVNVLYKLKDKHILIVDSLGVYNIKNITIDYVLLTQSPKLNLERLIDSLKPKAIIVDGNNYKSYISRWRQTCKKQKLPFYQTGKTGAFIIKD
ncbi:ComEC/Rec2 family competence protein [Psychroserpens sp. NJDZ02]|uniref:ComEC/Rec2 family competence protein n=1 Tax=Psychroserpens sp. NJDZ02 TaxID=2570561 RepID=UPI0010A8F776|nr:ComEC/Rec2 family competence protein [Psychroserpens sp. NJDZ02]QCE40702.1 ComEC/Rec2 family competence protein [Psychroserpens sp. NJDZ02]